MAFLAGIDADAIRPARGSASTYKPSVKRGYRASLETHVLPELGHLRITAVTPQHVQALADRLLAGNPASNPPRPALSASSVRNALAPLRVILDRYVRLGVIPQSPMRMVQTPTPTGRRDRVVPAAEARRLLAVLPEEIRGPYAVAAYAGLRVGEIQALTWDDVSLVGGVIRVRHSWDEKVGRIPPKSAASRRNVPITERLRAIMERQFVLTGDAEFVFPAPDSPGPFRRGVLSRRAHRVWKKAELDGVSPHELRHTYASYLIGAGLNAKAITTLMGHSSITITFDRYGHLFPGAIDEARERIDAYLTTA
jgi:integrase